MKKKKTTIICSVCGKKIKITADDAIIQWQFNGGCPVLSVRVKCAHCNQMSIIKKTPRTQKLLANRISASIPSSYR